MLVVVPWPALDEGLLGDIAWTEGFRDLHAWFDLLHCAICPEENMYGWLQIQGERTNR